MGTPAISEGGVKEEDETKVRQDLIRRDEGLPGKGRMPDKRIKGGPATSQSSALTGKKRGLLRKKGGSNMPG